MYEIVGPVIKYIKLKYTKKINKVLLQEERNVEILSIREACEKSIQQVKNEMETIVGEAEGKMKQYEVLLILISIQ